MRKWLVTSVIFLGIISLCGSFLLGLPNLLKQAMEGNRKDQEASCQSLKPTFVHPLFSSFPSKAPPFSLRNEKGELVSLSNYQGKVVLLTFWATWCKTCAEEMPSLSQLNEQMKGKPFQMLAVSNDQTWKEIHQFFPKGTSLPILLDSPSMEVAHEYGTEKLPETYLIDKKGNIRYYIVSERQIWHFEEVRSCFQALMDE